MRDETASETLYWILTYRLIRIILGMFLVIREVRGCDLGAEFYFRV